MRLGRIMACAAAAPLVVAAAQPVRLQPTSPWDVDYGENSCRLIRIFGAGKTETKLAFESSAPDEMDLLVVGKPLDSDADTVVAKFLPVGSKPFDGTVAKSVDDRTPAILWGHVPLLPADVLARLDREADERKRNPGVRPPAIPLAEQAARRAAQQQFASAVTELEIDTRRNRPVILETGSLGAPLAAMDQCSRDSLKDWGVDPDLEDRIVRPVWTSNAREWLFSSDYPRDLLMKGVEAQVSVRLLIDAAGHVTKCTSLSHFNEPEFNRITCDLISKRARFAPAELADGTKVPSYYTRRIVFQIAH